MIVQEVYDHRSGWHWLAQGEGPLRPIVVEGETRAIARRHWMDQFGQQYAEQECMTANSLTWQAECDAYRDL